MKQITKSQKSLIVMVLMLFTLLPIFHSAVSFSGEYNTMMKEQFKNGYYDDLDDMIDELADELEALGVNSKDAVKFVKRVLDGNISLMDFYSTNKTLGKYMDDSMVKMMLNMMLGSDGYDQLKTSITIGKIGMIVLILLLLGNFLATAKMVLLDGKEVPVVAPVVVLIVLGASMIVASSMDEVVADMLGGYGGMIDKMFVSSFSVWFAFLCSVGSYAVSKFMQTSEVAEGVDMSGVAQAGGDLLSSLGQKISTASQGVVAQTKTMTEITSINGQIASTQKEINQLYQQLGEQFYLDNKGTTSGDYGLQLSAIDEKHEKVAECQERVKELKGIGKCPSCQEDVEPNVPFCPHCGAEQPKAEGTASSEGTE